MGTAPFLHHTNEITCSAKKCCQFFPEKSHFFSCLSVCVCLLHHLMLLGQVCSIRLQFAGVIQFQCSGRFYFVGLRASSKRTLKPPLYVRIVVCIMMIQRPGSSPFSKKNVRIAVFGPFLPSNGDHYMST